MQKLRIGKLRMGLLLLSAILCAGAQRNQSEELVNAPAALLLDKELISM